MTSTVEITLRDECLLRACGRFRAVRTGDVCRLLFPGVRRDTALFRLRQLRRAHFLAVTSRGRTEEHIWRLGPMGREWLRSQGIEPGRSPHSGALAHHIATVGVWAALAIACHDRPGCRLRQVLADWELRAQPSARTVPVVPDLLVWVETPVAVFSLAVEVDRAGTEPLSVLRRKLDQYALAIMQPGGLHGAIEPTLLFALAEVGPGRARSVEKLLAAHWSYRFFVVPSSRDSLSQVLQVLAETPQPDPPDDRGGTASITRFVPTSAHISERPL